MSQILNGYRLLAPLRNDTSGNGKWGFAVKDGYEVFIKEFLTPVYPANASVFSEERRRKLMGDCEKFQVKKMKLYSRINQCQNGIIVTIIDFFRYESKYYVVSEKVDNSSVSFEELANLPFEAKKFLLKVIAKSVSDLHSKGVVHADLKPDNILFKKTNAGVYTARIIDFDSSFLEKEQQPNGEVEGDLLYLAPETFMKMNGQRVELTGKIDVFALGLIFYQILKGEMPYYDRDKYDYPFEAVLHGELLARYSCGLPGPLTDLLQKMLKPDPKKRIAMSKVVKIIEKL